MEFESVNYQNVVIVKLSGELSCMSTDFFTEKLEKIIKKKPKNIAVNMLDITFVDSTGLGALISNSNTCHLKDINLYLFSLKRTIKIVFEVSKLNTMFKILKKEEIEDKFSVNLD